MSVRYAPWGLSPLFRRPSKDEAEAHQNLVKMEEKLRVAHAELHDIRIDMNAMRKAMSEGRTNIKVDGKWVRLPRWSGHSGNACGAKTRYPTSPPCRNLAMANGKCRMHGGKTPPYASRRKAQVKSSQGGEV